MERMRTRPILLILAFLALACASAQGQTAVNDSPSPSPRMKPVPQKVRPLPFVIDARNSEASHGVEFRTVDQMTARDREQAANAESSIGEHTRYTGIEFNQGSWSYQQVVCPALPGHIFLRFLRNNGIGDVSMFTASIPRGDEGRVRIIPIQLRGYSLFSPAPVNAMTLSAFNHIRAEENPDHAPVPDWLGTGLCYAALAGAHPQLPPESPAVLNARFITDGIAMIDIPDNGGAVISLNDVSVPTRPMTWSMTFDGRGKLLKASHKAADLIKIEKMNPGAPPAFKRVPGGSPNQRTDAVPPSPSAVTLHPAPPPQSVPQAISASSGSVPQGN